MKINLILFLGLLCIYASCQTINGIPSSHKEEDIPDLISKVDKYIKTGKEPNYLGNGALFGCFTDNEFWALYLHLHTVYP